MVGAGGYGVWGVTTVDGATAIYADAGGTTGTALDVNGPAKFSLSGLVISTCVAIAQFWPHWAVIWIVPAIFFVGQTLSDYLLSPYFVGRRVNLNAVWIMFALFAFGYLFGFVGLLIAVPLASAIGVLTRFALQRYYESFLYRAIPRATVTDAVRLAPSDKKMD